MEVDLIVIGAGPAGQTGAVQAAKAGKSVLVIERAARPGGASVRRGSIPSKVLREQAQHLLAFRRKSAAAGLSVRPGEVPLHGHLRRAAQVAAAHAAVADKSLTRSGVERIRGDAHILAPLAGGGARVEIVEPGGARQEASAPVVLIATGSRPLAPAGIPLDHAHILDSDSILGLPNMPDSLLVLGGGVAACEYASTFAALGARVTLVDRGPRPLAFLDSELSRIFADALVGHGGTVASGAEVASASFDGTAVTVETSRGPFTAEKALVALGRTASVEGLGLNSVGVALNAHGHIVVDTQLRAAQGIYAAGDVVGPPALASTSMEQGRRAVRHAFGLPSRPGFDLVPLGAYTIPALASVGLSEDDARRMGAVVVGRARTSEIARGLISGNTDGLLKIVADPRGERILGVQAAGDDAPELVHVGQLAMIGGLGVDDLVDHVFNFPTMAEIFRVAALDVLARRP